MKFAILIALAACGRVGFQAPDAAAPLDAVWTAQPFTLTGQRFLLPCTPPGSGGACGCAGTPIQQLVKLGGAAFEHYHVTVRIRGIFEANVYTGGTPGPGSWYVGGMPTLSVNALYSLAVSSPPQVYRINQRITTQALIVADYEATFDVDGDASVLFESDSRDGSQERNPGMTIPGVTTVPSPYDGQFAQLDVISAVPF